MNETQRACFYFDINLDKSEEVFITNIVTCILNSVFSLLTCVGNSLILYAIRKSQNSHSPSSILLCCLAFSDLLAGAICQPLFVAYKTAEIMDNFSAYCILITFADITGFITSGVSLLTLAAVSIDRLLALTLHLRYPTIVTVHRVFKTALLLWIFAIACVLPKIWMSYANWILLPLVVFLLTLLIISSSTFKIFQIVRRHQRHINVQTAVALNLQTNTVNMRKCRRSAVTVLYVYGLFLIVYLPFSVTILLVAPFGYTRNIKIAFDLASTAVFINSFLNPLVYCWRIREIRRIVRNSLRIPKRKISC